MAASLSPRLASSSSSPKLKCHSFSISLTNLTFSNSIPQLGIYKISTWNGLRQLNMPKSRFILKLERKRRCKGVYASLFGVGAPEALVIGVVALLVFGPKGLAEVARNLGKTLRDFQPTIRELQEVSRDFKSTLEREIGLDEIQETTKPATRTKPTDDFVKANTPYSSPPLEESLGGEDVKISEEQVEASAAELQATDGSVLSKESETQEYLKQLEEQVQTLLSEKQRKFAPSATEVKSQASERFPKTPSLSMAAQLGTLDWTVEEASFSEDSITAMEQEVEELAAQPQEETLLPTESQAEPQSQSEEASFMEDNLKTKQQELEELAAQPHEETPQPTESQAEPQSHSEGTEVTWSSKDAETRDYLKKLEEEVQEIFSEQKKQTLSAAAEAKPEDSQEAASVSSPSQNSENQA